MVYIGHFSFVRRDPDTGPHYGWFTYVIEAQDLEEAKARIAVELHAIQQAHDLFGGIAEVTLEDIIEFESVPATGVLTRFTEYQGEQPTTIEIPLPCTESDSTRIYGAGSESEEVDVWDPFLVFMRDRQS